MDRTQAFLDWWRLNDGVLQNFGELQPYAVLHKFPEATDMAPDPLLIGQMSVQANVTGSWDPAEYRQKLRNDWTGFSERVIRTHRRVAEAWEPDQAVGTFSENGEDSAFTYERLLLPVITSRGGGRMLVTFTAKVSLN